MSDPTDHAVDILNSIKVTGSREIDLFKLDFNIVVRKIYDLTHAFLEILPNLIIAVLFFSLCMLLNRWTQRLIQKRFTGHKSVKLVCERLTRFAFLMLGFLLTFAIIFPSTRPIDFLGGLGIASLAVGFAIKDLLNNFLSGVLILLQQPFRVGDEIKHKDLEGVVDYINIRYTILIGFDGRKFLIPNGEIYSNIIVVNTFSKYRWSHFDLTVDLNCSLEKLKETLLSVINEVTEVLQEPAPMLTVTNITISTVTLHCAWTTNPYHSQVSQAKSAVLAKIQAVLNDENIILPSKRELFSQTSVVVTPNERGTPVEMFYEKK